MHEELRPMGAREENEEVQRMHRQWVTVEAEQFRTEPALSKEELKDSYIKIKVGFQTG